MQVVQLDKHIRLLDSPGVVLATKMADDAALVLRNCVRVSARIRIPVKAENEPNRTPSVFIMPDNALWI